MAAIRRQLSDSQMKVRGGRKATINWACAYPLLLFTGLFALLNGCSDPCENPDNEKTLKAAGSETGAIVTESGLIFRQLKAGFGPKPKPSHRVTVLYEGRLPDGKVFDSSKPGRPAEFKLSEVIPGWVEGLQMLNGGGRAKLTVPANLAYGHKGKVGKIPSCSVLIFEIELLGITD